METTIVVYLIWCILGLYRNNGKEQGSYYRYTNIYAHTYTGYAGRCEVKYGPCASKYRVRSSYPEPLSKPPEPEALQGARFIWGFPKIRGIILGVPIIRTIVFWGLYWGSLI